MTIKQSKPVQVGNQTWKPMISACQIEGCKNRAYKVCDQDKGEFSGCNKNVCTRHMKVEISSNNDVVFYSCKSCEETLDKIVKDAQAQISLNIGSLFAFVTILVTVLIFGSNVGAGTVSSQECINDDEYCLMQNPCASKDG